MVDRKKDIFNIEDKVFVITGGMGILGQNYIKEIISRGGKVAIIDILKYDNKMVEDITNIYGKKNLIYIKSDITQKEEISHSVNKIFNNWGKVDVLINNAAIDSPPDANENEVGPFEDYPESSYDKVMDVPCLSGCFMFIRTEIFKRVGLFDERFFMYLDDFDLSRRINRDYRMVYYPKVTIYHEYKRDSYKNNKLLQYHISSSIKYFNKWGWFFDKERSMANKKTLMNLNGSI